MNLDLNCDGGHKGAARGLGGLMPMVGRRRIDGLHEEAPGFFRGVALATMLGVVCWSLLLALI